MRLAQERLGLLAGDLVDRVDEQHLALVLGRLVGAQGDDDGFHRRVVEQAGAEAEDALDEVRLHQRLAQCGLLAAEEHAVREEDRGASGLGVEALGDVLEEGVVGAALRRDAPEVAAVGVVGEGVAVPRLDRVGRVGQHDVEGLQAVPWRRGMPAATGCRRGRCGRR